MLQIKREKKEGKERQTYRRTERDREMEGEDEPSVM